MPDPNIKTPQQLMSTFLRELSDAGRHLQNAVLATQAYASRFPDVAPEEAFIMQFSGEENREEMINSHTEALTAIADFFAQFKLPDDFDFVAMKEEIEESGGVDWDASFAQLMERSAGDA